MKNSITLLLLLCSIICLVPEADGADYYWVGNGGNWNDLSHWVSEMGEAYEVLPGPEDDVFFDSESFSVTGGDPTPVVTISTNSTCRNFTWTNITSTEMPNLVLSSGITLNIYGQIDIDEHVNISYDVNNLAKIKMLSTSPGITFGVATNGNKLPNIEFSGANGSWAITQNLAVEGDILITSGEVDAGADSQEGIRTITAKQFIVNGSSVNLDISRMNITTSVLFRIADVAMLEHYDNIDSEDFYSVITTPTFQVSSANADEFGFLTLNGSNGMLNASGQSITFFRDVILQGTTSNTILGAHTFSADLILEQSGSINKLESGQTQTFSEGSSIIAPGFDCSNYFILQSTIAGSAAIVSQPIGTGISLERFYLQDIEAVQMNQFSAALSVDLGNNTNWVFAPNASNTFYWIGGTGNWSDGSHWQSEGGGTGCIPTALDNVIFDENSFNSDFQVVTVDLPAIYFNDMSWSDPKQPGNDFDSPTWSIPSADVFIGGSMELAPTMSILIGSQASTTLNFVAESGSHTITAIDESENGFDLGNILFDGTGSWTLGGKLFSTATITFKDGNFSTSASDFNVEAATISIDGASSIITLNASEIFSTNFEILSIGTLNSGASNIYTQIFDITPSDLVFNELILQGEEGILRGTNLDFNDLNLSNTVKSTVFGSHEYFNLLQFDQPGMIVEFEAGSTQQIDDLESRGGDCGDEILVRSSQSGVQVNFVSTGGNISISNILLQDNAGTPDMAFTATRSQNLGNNSGWVFSQSATPRYFFWRGGTGDWNDGANWVYATNLNQTPNQSNCIPTPSDDVTFDADSFTDPGDVVTLDGAEQYCRSMTWTSDVVGGPTMNLPAGNSLNIYGSLSLLANTSAMTLQFGDGDDATFKFNSTSTGNVVRTSGHVIPNLEFNGPGGGWSVNGGLTVGSMINLINGHLNTNGLSIEADQFIINGADAMLTLGASNLDITSKFDITLIDPVNFIPGTSTITTNILESDIEGISFNQVVLDNLPSDIDASPALNGNSLIFNTLVLQGAINTFVYGDHQFNQALQFHVKNGLAFFYFESGSTQTFGDNGMLLRTSDIAEAPAFVESTIGGSIATFFKPNGRTCTDFLRITDINATPAPPPANEIHFGLVQGTSSVTDATGWTFTDLACDAFLPVECTDFAAAVQSDNRVELYWITAQEINNSGFEVQRSVDGRRFEAIAWIDGAGTTSEAQKYTFTDHRTAGLTEAYYRIKQIDFDGTSAFACDIQAVNFRNVGAGPLQVFPNPAGGQIQVRWFGHKTGTTLLRLFDQSGRLVIDREWSTLEGNNQRALPIADLPRGIYELQLVDTNGQMQGTRLIKQ